MIFIDYLSLSIWLFLIFFWGKFWLADRYLESSTLQANNFPSVCIVIPARNEVNSLSISLPSILEQNYQGKISVILVDDNSTDKTSDLATQISKNSKKSAKTYIIAGKPLPNNWKGKLWAIEQGIEFSQQHISKVDYFLFTDADIKHEPTNISQLVAKAERDNLDLVSLMVLLRCKSFWEKLLIPAFVFFFQKLYPFP